MRRDLSLLTGLLILAVAPPMEGASIVRLSDGIITSGESSPPERIVERIGPYTVVTYEFASYDVGEEPLSPGSYTVSSPCFTSVTTSGEPATLFRIDALNVEDTESATVEVIEAEYTDLHFDIAPATPLHLMTQEAPSSIPPIADYTGFKPSTPIREVDRLIHRGQGVVKILVTPAMYSKEDTVLRLYKKIKYRVSSQNNGEDEGLMFLSDEDSQTDMLEFDINHRSVTTPPQIVTSNEVSRSYLIIAHSQYQSVLQPFIEWKRTLGMKTKAVYSSSWTPASIKSTLRQEYSQDPNLQYVLFVGNYKQVPASYLSTGQISESSKTDPGCREKVTINCPTDYYYTLLTQNSIPELARGRIPVSTTEELSTVLNKIISYERTPWTSSDYYSKAVQMAYLDTPKRIGNPDPQTGLNDQLSTVAVSEEMHTYITGMTSMNISRLYSCKGPVNEYSSCRWNSSYRRTVISPLLLKATELWYKGSDDFITKLNEGVCYAFYGGHGEPDRFINEYFAEQGDLTFTKVQALNNGKKLPVILAMACQTANFTRTNIATAFMTQKSGGCVGYFGATNSITASCALSSPVVFASAVFNGGIFETTQSPTPTYISPALINTRSPTMGEVLNLMVLENENRISTSINVDSLGIKDRDALHYLGDPSMWLRKQAPRNLNVDASYSKGKISVSVSDEEEVYIAFYDMVTKETYCFKGCDASMTPSTTTSVSSPIQPNVKICVYGPNVIPHIAELKNGQIIVSDRVGGLSLQCENNLPSTITVSVIGEGEEFEGGVVRTVNLSDNTVYHSPLNPGESSTTVMVNSTGYYAVSFQVGDRTIVSQKIQVSK